MLVGIALLAVAALNYFFHLPIVAALFWVGLFITILSLIIREGITLRS